MKPINRLELFIILLSFVGDTLLLLLFFNRRNDERLEQVKKGQDAALLAGTIQNLTDRLEKLEMVIDGGIAQLPEN